MTVVTVLAAIISWFWAYTDFFTVVVGAFAQVITLGIGCLAASLIPFKRRDLYETSPIRGTLRSDSEADPDRRARRGRSDADRRELRARSVLGREPAAPPP